MTDKTKYFWIGKGVFGKKVGYGDPMPDDLTQEYADILIKKSKISDKKPTVLDDKGAVDLQALKKANKELQAENDLLKEQLAEFAEKKQAKPKAK